MSGRSEDGRASGLGDREIIELMRLRDPAGLEALLAGHGAVIAGWLGASFRLNADDHILQESVIDAALILWDRADRLDAARNLAGYFHRTSRYELLHKLGRRGRDQAVAWSLDQLPAAPNAAPPSPFVLALRALIAGLPELERQIVELDGATAFTLSADEIAALLGTTRRTVYSLRNRTKKRLDAFCQGWREKRA